MFGRKKTQEEIDYEDKMDKMRNAEYIICPHCEKRITQKDGHIEFDTKWEASLIGCPHCKKVIGGSVYM